MQGESRTRKTLRNTAYSFIYKFVDLVMAFLLRWLFIKALGMEYLGLSGLFTNILSVLSLVELGIGSAIVFALYEPLATGDEEKTTSLMRLYKNVYNTIGIIVVVIGALVTPFLKYVVNLPNSVEGIYLIYWITVLNTGASYFFSYKRSLLIADQRSDINTKNIIIFRFIRFFILSFLLISVHNYFAYLMVDVVLTIISNIQISNVVERKYPYLKKIKPKKLNQSETAGITKLVRAAIFSKIGQTVIYSTDNILISVFISTIWVGIYSNYSMITSNLEIMAYLFFNSITAAVGNYSVTNSEQKIVKLFKRISFVNFVFSYVLTVCVFCLISPFVMLWVGKVYVLKNITVAIIALNFYIATSQKSVENFLNSRGEMYFINRYRSLIESVINLGVSIVLVKYTKLGITGILLGTTICFFFGRVWMDAYTLYKHWFLIPYRYYLQLYVFRFILTGVTASLLYFVSRALFIHFGIFIWSWILIAMLIILITLATVVLIFHNTDEYKYCKSLFFKLVAKKVGYG
ncbi:MAG: hypothetical protein JEY71_16095 [Sphaerochaeta sp.]|nr:hypothetical protein [Sphaerochaeta sp.]